MEILLPTWKYADALMYTTNEFLSEHNVNIPRLTQENAFQIVLDMLQSYLDIKATWVKEKVCLQTQLAKHLEWYDVTQREPLSYRYFTDVVDSVDVALLEMLESSMPKQQPYDIWEIRALPSRLAKLSLLGDYRIEEFYRINPTAVRA